MGIVSWTPKLVNYGKRIINVMPEMMLGTGSEIIGAAARNTKGPALVKAKAGFKALEQDILTKKTTQGGFVKRLLHNIKTTPKDIGASAKAGYNAAKLAGKNSIWGGTKGFFKGLGQKMPFIGAALTVLFELPNIWTATKEQGVGQGVKEIAKTGSRLIGGAIGGAIGSAICPGIGSIIGWMAGDWLTSKIVGKSYSEKKMDAEIQAQEQAQQQAAKQTTFMGNYPGISNPYGYNDYYTNPYSDDLMMQQLNFNTLA